MTSNPLATISTLLQKLPPNVRLALYLLGFGIALVAPELASRGVIEAGSSALALQIAGVLTGGLASVVLGGQKNTSPADQVVAGVDALTNAERELQNQKSRAADALTNLTRDVPVLGPVAKQAIDRVLR